MSERAERIDLEAPISGDFQAVVRLIIGGIAERVDFAFEEIDDLQLAVERLLAETCTVPTVQLSFEVRERNIRTSVGPLSADRVSVALGSTSRPAGGPTLQRVLQTVVDSFQVGEAQNGQVSVSLQKVKATP
jgi:hypothetical protein